jgi:hypothetical protein
MKKVSDLPTIVSKLSYTKTEIIFLELWKRSLIYLQLCQNLDQNSLSIYLMKDLVLCYLFHPRLDHVYIGRPEHRPHRDPLPTRAAH